jgi:lipoprotein-anchoring transpeptidase ErfK/SrfK
MTDTINRRDFFKLVGLGMGALLTPAWLSLPTVPPDPEGAGLGRGMRGRVARRSIYLHSQPDLDSPRLGKIERDTLLDLLERVDSPAGPAHNPRWYRIEEGFVHSGYIQRVERAHLNPPVSSAPETGLPAEVTVPFTQAHYMNKDGYYQKVYRLYYESLHWVTGVGEGLDGEPWYSLTDEWLRVQYIVPAAHLRLLPAEELTPLSVEVPPEEKRIHVSLEGQTLTAFEAGQVVLHTCVATGMKYMETPAGEFFVNRKTPSKHMGNGGLTADPNAYELPGVPWVSFFHTNGSAFHGTYWHDNFGTTMSHGCVNLRTDEARWLYRWCTPVFEARIQDRKGWRAKGQGTAVTVE